MSSNEIDFSPKSGVHSGRMRLRIRAAQIRQLYAQTDAGLIAVAAMAVVVCFSLKDHVPHSYLGLWLLSYLAVQVPRHVLSRKFRRQTLEDETTLKWGRWFTIFTVLSGMIWGLAGFVFPPFLPPLHQFLLSMSVAGIASAAALVYSPVAGCCVPTLIVVLGPTALRFLLMGDDFFITIGGVTLLFAVVLILTTQGMNRAYVESLRLRFDNHDLIEQLTAQKAKADELNTSLSREIEERKRVEAAVHLERDRLQTFLEHAPIGMIMLSDDGTFLHINPKFRELFGYDLSDIPNGRAWFDVAYPDPSYRKKVIDSWKDDLKEKRTGEVRPRTFAVVCKDGSQKIIDFKPVQIGSGDHLMTCEDVTERLHAQQVLQESAAELERRVLQRTAELSQANDILQQEIAERRRAEEALRESEERYRLLSQRSLTGIYIHQDTLFVYVNETMSSMIGYSQSEMVGRPFWEFVHSEDREMVKSRGLAREAGKAAIPHYAFRLTRKDGETIWVEVLASTIPFGGRPANMGNVANITERKLAEEALKKAHGELEHRVAERTAQLRKTNEELRFEVTQRVRMETDLKRSEKKFRSLFESAPEIIHILDTNGVILQTNPAASHLLGFTEQELVGKSLAHFLTPRSRDRFVRSLGQLLDEGTCRDEVDLVCKNGVTISLDHSASVIRDAQGQVSSFVVFHRDMTEKRRALRTARQAARELEEALANATRLRVEADAANRAKSEFLATMSHELRTPLNAIIGFSEILEDQTFGKMNEKQVQFVGYVLESGRHLLELINDILDLSKIESGKTELQLEPLKLGKFLRSSLVTIKERAKEQQVSLEVSIEETLAAARILADEMKLKQVMFNLLSNAVKFTPEKGRICLDVRKARNELVISVTDSGIGLSPENYERIFGAFEQVDSSLARRQQGTGLGLALTQRLVQLQGGDIWVESAGLGMGSTFTFTIPWVETHYDPLTDLDASAPEDSDADDDLEDSWVSFRTMRSHD